MGVVLVLVPLSSSPHCRPPLAVAAGVFAQLGPLGPAVMATVFVEEEGKGWVVVLAVAVAVAVAGTYRCRRYLTAAFTSAFTVPRLRRWRLRASTKVVFRFLTALRDGRRGRILYEDVLR